jgi:nitrite transporter NirC
MSDPTPTALANAAEAKSLTSRRNPVRYFVSSSLAGIYVGLGILLILTIGAQLAGAPFTKTVMGASFGIALSLVIVTAADLFTGNNMVMTAGWVARRTSLKDAGRVWGLSYIGNFTGGALLAWLFYASGLAKGAVGTFTIALSHSKMTAPFWELLARGVLCNILVCLAVYSVFRLKSESARLIMTFWCLFAFITCGFEHSVANMALLTLGLLADQGETLALSGLATNLIPVTIGNMIGGCLLGAVYAWLPATLKGASQ